MTHNVYVLRSDSGARVVYGGGFVDWRRYWRLYCIGQGWKHCAEDPLWPSRSKPTKRTEVAYTIDLLKAHTGRWNVLDAKTLLSLVGGDRPTR